MHSPKRASFISSSGPSYMTKEQMGDYLNNLRSFQPPRSQIYSNLDTNSQAFPPYSIDKYPGTARSSGSSYSDRQSLEIAPCIKQPANESDTGNHRAQVHHQKQLAESRDIRAAMKQLDIRDESSVYFAAQQQAAQLIHEHRKQSQDAGPDPLGRSACTGPETAANISHQRPQKSDIGNCDLVSFDSESVSPDFPNIKKRSSYSKLANYWNTSGLAQRRRSSGSKRSISGKHKGIFTNPGDRIYEDPPERISATSNAKVDSLTQKPPTQPALARKPPFARAYSARDSLQQRTHGEPDQRGDYSPVIDVASSKVFATSNESKNAQNVPDRDYTGIPNGPEIRCADIRAATNVKRKDLMQKLPRPTAVSDSPERPIVSFSAHWTPEKEQGGGSLRHQPSFTLPGISSRSPSSTPTKNPKRPKVPDLHNNEQETVSKSVPTIRVEQTAKIPGTASCQSQAPNPTSPIPNIVVANSESQSKTEEKRAREAGQTPKCRYSPFPAPQPQPKSSPLTHRLSKPHITPTGLRKTALCAQCALPIAGRIVSAAGLRFHPNCFTCCYCGEGLECVDFYPEPADKRDARLDRIQRRMDGENIKEVLGATETDDGDDSLRFYCHLDFHELFSPRCKSCKTPIEGEVVVACGAEWHVGHFFCAQCGDPFDQSTPYIEKEGYAWCVECHTNRYSAKCRRCKKPVTNMVVQALNAEWHNECFCCTSCGSSFDDGRFFLRAGTQDPVCLACEQKRLRA